MFQQFIAIIRVSYYLRSYSSNMCCGCIWITICPVWPVVEGCDQECIVRPVFRYFTPMGPRKFCAPTPLSCSYSVMCKQKQHKKTDKRQNIRVPSSARSVVTRKLGRAVVPTLFSVYCRSPLNFSLFSRIPYFNLDFF
jgi:hypothetical protein